MVVSNNNIQLCQLWNKLGSKLANSNQSTKALEAHHAALSIKPKHMRSWLNMDIAHSNLKHYGEASRFYLQTLILNRDSEHCWNYLRITLFFLKKLCYFTCFLLKQTSSNFRARGLT